MAQQQLLLIRHGRAEHNFLHGESEVEGFIQFRGSHDLIFKMHLTVERSLGKKYATERPRIRQSFEMR